MTKVILNFIRKNPLNRYIIGFISIFVLGTLIALFFLYPVRLVYYGVVDGNYLLNVQSVTAEKRVEQDDGLSVAFCRDPRVRIVAKENIRTFYLSGDNKAVYQRNLPENISYEKTDTFCQPLTIKSDQRPNDLGKYRFCQEFDFFTDLGQKKSARFCSTEYEVIPPTRDTVDPETLNVTEE